MFDEEYEDLDYSKGNVKPWNSIIKIVLEKKSEAILLVLSVLLLAAADLTYPY